MPGAKPKVKGKKRKSISGTPDDERAPAPSTAAAREKDGEIGKSKKAMEDGDGGSEPVDERFAKLPSFDVELDSDLDEDPVDEDDDFDEAAVLDHEDDVSDDDDDDDDDDDEGGDSDDDGNEDEKRADKEPTPDEVKAAYDSDFDIDGAGDGAGDGDDDDADAGGPMDPAEPELFEFDDDNDRAGGKKVLSEKALKKARADQAKRGVVYLGSIPPFMKPQKLRQLLTPYGDLDGMYLMPEDPRFAPGAKSSRGTPVRTLWRVGLSSGTRRRPRRARRCSTERRWAAGGAARTSPICGT